MSRSRSVGKRRLVVEAGALLSIVGRTQAGAVPTCAIAYLHGLAGITRGLTAVFLLRAGAYRTGLVPLSPSARPGVAPGWRPGTAGRWRARSAAVRAPAMGGAPRPATLLPVAARAAIPRRSRSAVRGRRRRRAAAGRRSRPAGRGDSGWAGRGDRSAGAGSFDLAIGIAPGQRLVEADAGGVEILAHRGRGAGEALRRR